MLQDSAKEVQKEKEMLVSGVAKEEENLAPTVVPLLPKVTGSLAVRFMS